MGTFDTVDELWFDMAWELIKFGEGNPSRDGDMAKEVLGYTGRLADPKACFMFNPDRKMSASYAAAELLWYLSGTGNIEMVKAYAPQYERFAEPDGFAYGAYGARWQDNPEFRVTISNLQHEGQLDDRWMSAVLGPRWRPLNQLDMLCALLMKKGDTRQAVVSMWKASDLVRAFAGDRKDLPCTLSLQFLVRQNKLNLICTMRSNDLWLGTPYDVFSFCMLQQIVADVIGCEVGWYQHQVGSLHVYQRNFSKFSLAAEAECYPGPITYPQPVARLEQDIEKALKLEKFNREAKTCAKIDEPFVYSPLGQLVVMAATKWSDCSDKIENKKLREFIQCS